MSGPSRLYVRAALMCLTSALAVMTVIVVVSSSVSGSDKFSDRPRDAVLNAARLGLSQRHLRLSVRGQVVSVSTIVASKKSRRVSAVGVCSRRAGTAWTLFVTRAHVLVTKSGTSVSGSRRTAPGQYAYRSCIKRGRILTLVGPYRFAAVQSEPIAEPPTPSIAPAPTSGVSSSTSASGSDSTNPEPSDSETTSQNKPPAGDDPPAGAITPEQFGAVGNGRADDTAALQRALDAVKSGGTLWLADGKTYTHSAVLQARQTGETIAGPGTLLATNQSTSSFWVAADDVTVDGPTFDLDSTSKRWDAYEQMGVRVAGVTGTVLRRITVKHSAAAGIYVGQGSGGESSNFLLDHVRVQNTRADGIHMTGGSHDGIVRSPTVTNSGDDAVAVVSYSNDGVTCNHIEVDSPTVHGTTWGRGLSVVGGQYVTYNDIDVNATNAAAIYIANEGAPFYTASSSHVTVSGGTITDANTNSSIGHGAVLVYSSQSGRTVSDVNIHDVKIEDTRSSAPWTVGVRSDGGSVDEINMSDLGISGRPAALVSNVSGADYSATDWTVNGAPFNR